MSFLNELWRFMRERKKFWLLPIFVVLGLFGALLVLTPGLGGGAVHLHAVLSGFGHSRCVSWGSRRSITTAPPRSSSTASGRRRSGGALHAQEARCAAFRGTPSPIALSTAAAG